MATSEKTWLSFLQTKMGLTNDGPVPQVPRGPHTYKVESMRDIGKAPYIVMLGDVGSGKSTICEKLTGQKGRASDSDESVTKTSETFWSLDGTLVICDTPGSNARKDTVQHNVWIAAAINFLPVSKIFIVTKADPRLDNVVTTVKNYANSFLDVDPDCVAVLMTHMDTVKWSEEKCIDILDEDLGINTVVFSSMEKSGDTIVRDIHKVCTKGYKISVDQENFFQLFKISNNNRKILACTSREVKSFRELKLKFNEARKQFISESNPMDLLFEFQAWMAVQITEAQKRISLDCGFSFFGENAANEAGHIASMTNQLRAILYDIRVEAHGMAPNQDQNENIRKCPHCGLVWTKVEGCNGATICGSRPEEKPIDTRFGEMATFTFFWSQGKLKINKTGTKAVQTDRARMERKGKKVNTGCGKRITWSNMGMATIPKEFHEQVKMSTDDISLLPKEANKFKNELGVVIKEIGVKMTLGEKPQIKK